MYGETLEFEVSRFVYKLEFRTLRIFHEIKQVELQRKNGLFKSQRMQASYMH